jgi:hypothetical protein
LIHEDLKAMDRWLNNQVKYASLEAVRIKNAPKKSFKDRLRLIGVSPLVCGAYAYLKAGGPLRRGASDAYAFERLIFEAILARMLADNNMEHISLTKLVADDSASTKGFIR